jgi:nucleoside-diphosphate-sugar epimerase
VSKLAGERYAILFHKVQNLDVTVLRYFHVFGSRQESNQFGGVVSIFIRNMLKNEQPVIFGSGDQQRSFTYVKDVVAANLLCAVEAGTAGQVYNCASGVAVTINELCGAVIDAFGKKGKVVPRYEDWMTGDIVKFQVSSGKIRDLGLRFDTDFFGRLSETIADMRERGVDGPGAGSHV